MCRIAVSVLFVLFETLVFSQAKLVRIEDFGDNPGNLNLFINPGNSRDAELKPLIIALHGCSQTPKSFTRDTGLASLANDYDFITLYPTQKRSNNPYGCFNWFLNRDQERRGGELESIINMIDYAIRNYPIDTGRIYVFGLSAGAAMGVALMSQYPEKINAGAVFAGAPYKAATNAFEASGAILNVVDKTPEEWGALVSVNGQDTYPKLIVLHGELDRTVNPKNANELIEQWTSICNIDTTSDTLYHFPNTEVDRYGYKDQFNEEKVVYFKVGNIGHAVPIDPGTERTQGGKTGLFAKDVDFFSSYYVLREFGIIQEY